MANKNKAPDLNLPATPAYYEDPNYSKGMEKLTGLGNRLTSFDFSGDLAPLADTINIDPNVTAGYFKSLEPYYKQLRQQTVGQLAANNQLESSVTANRLGQIDTDVSSLLQGKVSDQLTQAMQNRISLFGTGLNTINTATSLAQGNQSQRNAFNMESYDRLVDQALAKFSMTPQSGGFSGAATGALGGALTGYTLGGPWGAAAGAVAGGLYGGLSTQPGSGSALMTTGAGLYGSRSTPTGLMPYQPGSSASNSPFSPASTTAPFYKPLTYASLYGGLN